VDWGETWHLVNDDFDVYNLTINSADPQQMWAIFYTGYMDWIWGYSQNGGQEWAYGGFIENNWVVNLTVDQISQPIRLYAFTDHHFGLYKSVDLGQDRTAIGEGLYRNQFVFRDRPLVINSHDPTILYVGTSYGTFRSNDEGSHFDLHVQGMLNTYIFDIAVHPNDPITAYVGSWAGFFKTIDAGNTWHRLLNRGVKKLAIDPQFPDTIYATSSSG